MKFKTWQLFVLITSLFVCSFYVINLKFDKFYRVNGINNDNRVLIEKYLDEDEQTYLIDNQIQIHLFIDYIEYDDFHLQNYQYYNALKATKRYKTEDILSIGNSLAQHLSETYGNQAYDHAVSLIDASLEQAYLNESDFRFDYLTLYSHMKKLYANDDYSFVKDTHLYVLKLNALGMTSQQDITNTFYQMTTAYNKEALTQLMNEDLSGNITLVFDPYELTTIVNDTNYISLYEPSGLLLTQDIPRTRYTMYLQSEAYHALLNMYQALKEECDGFLLRNAYQSVQALPEDEVGHNEFQLGLSIDVTKQGIAYRDFESTDIYAWLLQHAHEYGFILRYPNDKTQVTNHAYDSHIFRYVGTSLAKTLHDSNLILEEYKK